MSDHFVQNRSRVKLLALIASLATSIALLLVLAWIVLPWQVARADPGVIRVTRVGATSGQCGGDWVNPCDLQYALNTLAVSGTEIWVAAGIYTPTALSTNVSATFALTNGVGLYGGFAMTETALDQRNWANNVTVLSGDIDHNDVTDANGVITETSNITGSNSYHVVMGNSTNSTAILDGFTVTGGNANSSIPDDRGGGMYNNGGNPTVRNVTVSGNAGTYGGGLYNYNSSPTLSNVIFSGNSVISHSGGGLYNEVSSPTLVDVLFIKNSAAVAGGGMTNNGSSPTLTSITFTGNSAIYGGGMFNVNPGNPILTNVTFTSNTATYGGGGLYNQSSNPTLSNVTFNGNSATFIGGGIGNQNSRPTLTNVTFMGNSALAGGGMYNDTSDPALVNVTFSSNSTSGGGGGLFNATSSPTLTNVTFSGNSADTGGAISNVSSSNPSIRNTILWGNTATTTGSQLNNDSASNPTVADSVVQGGYLSGTNIITANPWLGPLGNYGGGTPILPVLPGSSAIDTANDANCPASDQRGIGRPQGAHCDIGAFESRRYTLSIISGNNQSAQINTAFPSALAVTVTSAFSEPVEGGRIIFTAPVSGASAALTVSPATISGGAASVTALANSTAGSYSVTVSAAGVITPVNFSLTNNRIGTTTTLTSSVNPSTLGQLLTLTAAVTSTIGIPTGNVVFYDSGILLSSGTIDVSGQVTYSTSSLLVGTHSITATYGGDTSFNPSTSPLLNQVVLDTPIGNLSAINDSPTTLGHATTFTATASGSNIAYTWNFGDHTPTATGTPVTHTYSLAGLYIATVTATNGVSIVVATTPVTITNLAPIANAGTPQTVLVNALVTLNGSGSFDPDGHVPLTYGWTQSGGPGVVLISPIISMPTFTAPSTPNVLTFTLVVTDARGLASAPSQVVVTVTDTPIGNLSAINDSPTTLGHATTFTATASGSNIAYTWNFGDHTPTATGTPVTHTYSLAGLYIATVTATNGVSIVVATTPVTITNLAPIANAGTPQTVLVNALVTLNGSGSFDPDGHVPLTYGWTQSGGPGVVLSSPIISMPTFTAPSTPNVLTFTLVVTDARGLASAPSQAVVTVTDTPIGNLSAINDSPTTLGHATTFTATASGSNIAYTWNFGDHTPTATGTPVTHTYSLAGLYIATVTATNGVSIVVATTPVTITNLAPIANAGTPQTVLVNALVTLNGSGSFDPDGHVPLTYGWTQSGGPGVVLSSPIISMPTFTAPSTPNVLTFTLVVTDARGLASAPSQAVVTVTDTPIGNLSAINDSPTTLGHATTFTATASGSNIAYTWNFGDHTPTATGTPVTHTYSLAGLYIATVTATNGVSIVVATTPVTITNLAPIANAGTPQTVLVNALVTLNGSGSFDPDGHVPLTYGWTQSGGPGVVLSSPIISMPTFTAPSTPNVLTFTLVVTDARGLASAPSQVVVNVPYRVQLPLILKTM